MKLEDIKKDLAKSDIFQRTLEALKHGESVIWEGCFGSSFAFLGGVISETLKRPMLVVVSKVAEVEHTANSFSFFTNSQVLTYPIMSASSLVPTGKTFFSNDTDFGKRLRVLKTFDEISSTKDICDNVLTDYQKTPIVVSSLTALLQPVPTREQIVDDSIKLVKGSEIGRDALICWLEEGKYASQTAVKLPGEYSERGDIVDVYAVDWDSPVRLEFFGDELESIRTFDVVDQRSLEDLDSIEITRLSASGTFKSCFIDRLPENTVVLIVDTDEVVSETTRLVAERSKTSVSSVSELMNALYRYPTLHAVSLTSGIEYASLTINAHFSSVERFQGDFIHVEETFKKLSPDEYVFIACASEKEAQRLETTFLNMSSGLENRLLFLVGVIASGFEWRDKDVYFIGADQLFGRTASRCSRKHGKKELREKIDSFMELAKNDYVIHEDYGLARYLGLETTSRGGLREDYLKLEFANEVYVSVEPSKIHKIQRYIGVEGHKVRLSSYNKRKVWNDKKSEAQKAIWAYAHEMLDVQATRDLYQGIAFPHDGDMQQSFESLFPYRETDDQLTAIEEVKKDMERTRPMDRLLCGDVGFGKTEVALRAAFKAVVAGYQVAVMAPTTVLVEQHYRTFHDRMSAFSVIVDSLSGSEHPKQRETIAKLAKGAVDIVIGTQRLLSKDVSFKKLGLIIIDEEQKFGVAHKESLKKFLSTVDVLTMTATPIPRTLQLSILGMRDISILKTPPEDRLPVETEYLRFNEEFIRFAILREINRGGQVYYLHNKIIDIEEIAQIIREIVPEARVRVGHGKMSFEELETTMRDFVRRQFDILVCTTIVESGLDIPNANTIFIDNGHNLGIPQVHQLRGRVGRGKRQGYCYLVIGTEQILSTRAKQRLHAIKEYNQLGAGFQIAMRDMEIRGAGNILGKEQSGHIATIGYEMYCELLEAAVRALKHEPQKIRIDVDIDLPISALLDPRYIRDESSIIDFYRRFSRAATIEQAEALRKELQDRFGNLPRDAEHFFELSKIRVIASAVRIKKIQYVQALNLDRTKMLEVEFCAFDRCLRFEKILKRKGMSFQFIDEKTRGRVKIPRDIFDEKNEPDSKKLLKFISDLLLELSKELNKPEEQQALDNAKRQIGTVEKHDQEKDGEEREVIRQPLRARILKYKNNE